MFLFYKLASLPTRLVRVGDMVPLLLVNIILCEWGSCPENSSVIFYDCFFYECALCYTKKYYCACMYMYSFPFRSLTFFSPLWLGFSHIISVFLWPNLRNQIYPKFYYTYEVQSELSSWIVLHNDTILMMDWVAGRFNTIPFPFQFQFIM